MFTKYGYSTLSKITAFSIVLIIISFFLRNDFLKIFLTLVAVVFLVFSMFFFRDPDRKTPDKNNVVISPADGKVLFVKNVFDDKFILGEAKQISIFMSPLNVHVNRIPISGSVSYLKYFHGKFFAAFDDKASQENERVEIGIATNSAKILFTQVAGFIARRIVYTLEEGDEVKMGERFGMIKFGSRVDVIVPSNWVEQVKEGETVYAGETILFEQTV